MAHPGISYCHNGNFPNDTYDPLELFRRINKLSQEKKWNSILNKPKLFLIGEGRKEANEVYRKLVSIMFFFSVGFIYDHFLPEEYRFKYKYQKEHGHVHKETHDH
ncbi:unnamed protein product [Dracunculus medinensis]|uniref:Uncharacterized protein n=1 Tax=Dracunculus medinensis TaxID=318479 RepID=A0A3P7QF83_DRAME|nr:unnamed protein product [Dracunculus medinensis]